jgi:ABC-2 type transport system ATP-binding protein
MCPIRRFPTAARSCILSRPQYAQLAARRDNRLPHDPDAAIPCIQCVGLTKRYGGSTPALNDVTLDIAPGTCFGLLGENGAGKTTLVRLLMGFVFPTSGRVSMLGEDDVTRAHDRIGYVHEHAILETRFSGRAYLRYLAQLSGLWGDACRQQVEATLEQSHLRAAADQPIHTYSKGMRQRLAIAQALLSDPALLILDEPTSGLDPGGQWEVRSIIADLRGQGRTILICSHYLAEVEQLCDQVGILRRGQLVACGAVADLLQRQEDEVEIVLAGDEPAGDVVERLGLREHVLETLDELLRIPTPAQPDVLAALVAAGVPLRSLNPASQTLEALYLRVVRDGERAPGGERAQAGPASAPLPAAASASTAPSTGGA